MKQIEDPPLQPGVAVDKNIGTENQLGLHEGGAPHEVMPEKRNIAPNAIRYDSPAIANMAIISGRAETSRCGVVSGEFSNLLLRIYAGFRLFQRLPTDIRGVNPGAIVETGLLQ